MPWKLKKKGLTYRTVTIVGGIRLAWSGRAFAAALQILGSAAESGAGAASPRARSVLLTEILATILSAGFSQSQAPGNLRGGFGISVAAAPAVRDANQPEGHEEREKPMRRTAVLGLCVATVGVVLTAPPAFATPIVALSTYSVSIRGTSSGETIVTPVTFDGTAESFARTFLTGGSVDFSMDEAQSSLGGGNHQVLISILADGDLFPVSGEDGFLRIGNFNPLDLAGAFRLDNAFLTFYRSDGSVFNSYDFVAGFPSFFTSDPWNGVFINFGFGGGFTNVGGLGVNAIDLDLRVSQIPEPTTLSLLGLGLAAFAAARRRRASASARQG